MRAVTAAVILSCGLAASAFAQQAPPAAVPVGTVPAERRPVAKSADFVGRVQAINRVDIQARVTGFLDQVLFTEGDMVKEGQKLYQIEKDQFQATVDQADGALASAKANKLLTAIQFQRAEDLMKTNAGTVVARDQALTADRDADAKILVDQANLETAKINLGYTDITSPIVGKIGRTLITKGNVVSPQTGMLTTIVSVDPTYVLFPVSQRAIMRAQDPDHPIDVSNIKVNLRFTDNTTYGEVGKIDFVGVTVDKSTDTVEVRAVFPNAKGSLIDGQLVTVNLEAAKPEEQIVIPQAALISDQQGIYVFIAEDGKAAIRRIKTGGASGEDIVVTEGLKGGELVIVEGTQTLRPGTPVQSKPVTSTLNRS
ncbi:MAG TPA: efflux RND transporter periplasmic adaptor subunit [Stellaceae bacterium]|jgi:membrane fusion protein (multidrug efflux system)|nr:efflux RND transporter periplasmic adaptor subunit [Stellaceae bacterium]